MKTEWVPSPIPTHRRYGADRSMPNTACAMSMTWPADSSGLSLMASGYRIAGDTSLHYNHHTSNRLKVWTDAEGNH
jgi:hypothetical protein